MQGQLFTHDFLTRGVLDTPPFQALDEAGFAAFSSALQVVFNGLNATSTLNEAQTEQLIIHKVLTELGWLDDTLPQVNADPKGREAVPDCLLFASASAKAAALLETKDDRRYRHGLAILEAKRWLRPLDRGDGQDAFDPDAPSSQMLRYLSRVDVASDRAVKWGVLTNGAVWRLYWQDARSRSEAFFEIDLAAAFGLAGVQQGIDVGVQASEYVAFAPLLLANFSALVFDYVARQKVQGQHLNWFVVEQLPVIAPARFQERLPAAFAKAMRAAKLMNGHHPHPTVADFVMPQVLVLSYTAHDMVPFARDLGYVDAAGQVLPPFVWDEEGRRARLAALDAVFFYLYGLDAKDAAYILSTFPIVREQDQKTYGRYRTQDDILELLCLLTPYHEKTQH